MSSVAHPEFLGFGGKLIEHLGPGLVILALVRHEVLETHAPVLADGAAGDFALIQQLHQVGPRDVEQVSGLLGGQLGMGGNQGDGITLGHLRQHVQERPQGGRRHRDGFGFFSAVENLDAGAGAAVELVRGEAAAGFAHALGVGLGRHRPGEPPIGQTHSFRAILNAADYVTHGVEALVVNAREVLNRLTHERNGAIAVSRGGLKIPKAPSPTRFFPRLSS